MCETISKVNVAEARELKDKHDKLKERAMKVAKTLSSLIPVNDRSALAQEGFLLTLSDLGLLDHGFKGMEKTISAVDLEQSDDSNLVLSDVGLYAMECAKDMFGISKEVMIPATIKDLRRELALIEAVVARAEGSVSAAQSA